MGSEDGVQHDVGKEWGKVAERLVCAAGDNKGMVSSSHSWPAVTVSWRQGAVLLPLHLETNGHCERKPPKNRTSSNAH